ncbi:hypothetical protein MO973_11225 [Paenibacillus sp. TRM 82003]|nr:hypothetical protein [Paenibacillus sp. TRM 82003]
MTPIYRRGLLIAGLILAIAAVIAIYYKFPLTIDRSYPAVQYRADTGTLDRATTVTVKGTLYRPLFRDPTFKGSIQIPEYAYTQTDELIDVTFHDDILGGWASLTYSDFGEMRLRTLGSIWIEGDFDGLKILVYEPIDAEQKESTDLTLIAPASSVEEAIEKAAAYPAQ